MRADAHSPGGAAGGVDNAITTESWRIRRAPPNGGFIHMIAMGRAGAGVFGLPLDRFFFF